MVRRVGLRRKAVDEGDRFEKVAKRILLPDRVALERPTLQIFDALLGFSSRKFRHSVTSVARAPRSYSGLRARTSSSRTRAASTAASASRCSSIAVGPSLGFANALPAIVR